MAAIQKPITDFFRKKDKRKADDDADTEGPRKISSDPPRDGKIDNKKHKSNEPTPEAPPAPAKASPFSFGAKPAAEPMPAPKPASPFSFGGGSKPAAKPKPEPEPVPKPVFGIFDGAKPPPKQDFEAPPYKPFTVSQREGLTAEFIKSSRLDARRKKTLAKTYEVTESQVDNYWKRLKEADSSYVKKHYRTKKPEVATGIPAHGDLPLDALTAIKGAYDEDTSFSTERAEALVRKYNIKLTQVHAYFFKLRQRDPNYQMQTYIYDGKAQERKLAKRQAQRDAKLSLKGFVAPPADEVRKMLDVVLAQPALRDAVYVGKSPIVKAFFENLRSTCADVSLLHVAQTGSRLIPGTFVQICYGVSTLLDERLRLGIPLECVRPVAHYQCIPFRVPKVYPQKKGKKEALEFACVTPIYTCDAGASNCLMARELEAALHALADADVLRPPVPAKKYDEEAYNTPIEVLTRGHEARAPIGKYSRGDKFGVYAVFFKEDEFRPPTRAEHAAFLQTRLDHEEKTKARRAARKAAGELDDSDDSESEDDDC